MECVISPGGQNSIKTNGAIGKTILSGIMNSLAYLLAQNIDPHDVTEKLRLCIGINHQQRHWTGLVVDIEGFLPLYKEMYAAKLISRDIEVNEHCSDLVLAGRQINFIYSMLGLDARSTSDDLLNCFSGKLNITLNHYDSMNCKSYYNEVIDSINQLVSFINVTAVQKKCSQQKGNTCGDHTTCNLVGIGLYGILPVINQDQLSMVTSNTLRTLTDKVNQSDSTVKNMTSDVLQQTINNQKTHKSSETSSEEDFENPIAEKLVRIIDLYADRIALLAPEKATELLNAIHQVKGETISEIEKSLNKELEQFSPNPLLPHFFESYTTNNFDELQDRILTLAGILHNTNNKAKQFIFKELGITDEDCTPYCEVSKAYLREKQTEIESKVLSVKYPIGKQEAEINRYNKK